MLIPDVRWDGSERRRASSTRSSAARAAAAVRAALALRARRGRSPRPTGRRSRSGSAPGTRIVATTRPRAGSMRETARAAVGDPHGAAADAHVGRDVADADPGHAPRGGVDAGDRVARRRGDPDAAGARRDAVRAPVTAIERATGSRGRDPEDRLSLDARYPDRALADGDAVAGAGQRDDDRGAPAGRVDPDGAPSGVDDPDAPAPTATPLNRPPLRERRAGAPRPARRVGAIERVRDGGPHGAGAHGQVVRAGGGRAPSSIGVGARPGPRDARDGRALRCRSRRRRRGPSRCRSARRARPGAGPDWWSR